MVATHVFISPDRSTRLPARSTNIGTMHQFVLPALAGVDTESAEGLAVHFVTDGEILAGLEFSNFATFNECLVYALTLVADERAAGSLSLACTCPVAEAAVRHNMASLVFAMMDHLHGLAILEDAAR